MNPSDLRRIQRAFPADGEYLCRSTECHTCVIKRLLAHIDAGSPKDDPAPCELVDQPIAREPFK